MSERDTYPAGVPCWVENIQADPEAGKHFYSELFGWQFSGDREYAVARLRGLDVAGIAPRPSPAIRQAWFTHVRVEDADRAAETTRDAGGSVIVGPFDAQPAGRLAVVADPAGAQLCLWEADAREGAQVVNESNAWANSALQTADPKAAGAFYEAVFGWAPETWGPMTLFRLPGYVGGEPDQPVPRDVVAVMMPADGTASWNVDFRVDDADATAALAARKTRRVSRNSPIARSRAASGPSSRATSRRTPVGSPDISAASSTSL